MNKKKRIETEKRDGRNRKIAFPSEFIVWLCLADCITMPTHTYFKSDQIYF